MSEPRASKPKKKTITEYTFYFVGGNSTVVAIESPDQILAAPETLTFKLKDRYVFVSREHVLWHETRDYQVPVKEPAGPPQTQNPLFPAHMGCE